MSNTFANVTDVAPQGNRREDSDQQQRTAPGAGTGYAAQAAALKPGATSYAVQAKSLSPASPSAPAAEADDPAKVGEASLTTGPNASPRFGRDKNFAGLLAGTQYLRKGASGTTVTKLQQALLDLGFTLPKYGVDGQFGEETDAAVRAFQGSKSLKVDGVVGPDTSKALDMAFATYQPYATMAKQVVPGTGDPLAGTRKLSDKDRKDINSALSLNKPGEVGEFKPSIGGLSYHDRLRTAMNAATDEAKAKLVTGKDDKHGDPKNLYDWKTLEDVAVLSKRETDKVFGGYASKPALKSGVNLKDQWEEQTAKEAKMGDPEKLAVAKELSEYFLQTRQQVLDVRREHHAGNRAKEKGIEETVATEHSAARRDEMVAIERNWPGEASPAKGEVRMQRLKGATTKEQRNDQWRFFQTFIHEYLHLETHPRYFAYAESLSGDKDNALAEGMTDVFTRTVWSNVVFDKTMRQQIEGPLFDEKDPFDAAKPSALKGYKSLTRAEEAMSIAGFHNVAAAYFLGRTDLIGDIKKKP